MPNLHATPEPVFYHQAVVGGWLDAVSSSVEENCLPNQKHFGPEWNAENTQNCWNINKGLID